MGGLLGLCHPGGGVGGLDVLSGLDDLRGLGCLNWSV